MASFIINTKAEILKCRKTAAYWLTLLASVFVPLLSWLMLVAKPEHFVKKLKPDAWHIFMNMCWEPAAAFFLPMYVILVTSLIVQIEYRNNSWKQVYASPRSYADIFFSKFLVIHLMIIASLVLFNVFMVISALTANALNSGYTFLIHPIPGRIY
ncbi:ABC transporter permease [Paraflavitalea speifideaquila]|uniref:ABC transporter permease n=1 Tax=Paraflavitalea speifideaquila TaxID=3076558 RepID=UPI0028ED0376|nr:ABC transporter permease [Paraflavitalea speifideiaquila]